MVPTGESTPSRDGRLCTLGFLLSGNVFLPNGEFGLTHIEWVYPLLAKLATYILTKAFTGICVFLYFDVGLCLCVCVWTILGGRAMWLARIKTARLGERRQGQGCSKPWCMLQWVQFASGRVINEPRLAIDSSPCDSHRRQ